MKNVNLRIREKCVRDDERKYKRLQQKWQFEIKSISKGGKRFNKTTDRTSAAVESITRHRNTCKQMAKGHFPPLRILDITWCTAMKTAVHKNWMRMFLSGLRFSTQYLYTGDFVAEKLVEFCHNSKSASSYPTTASWKPRTCHNHSQANLTEAVVSFRPKTAANQAAAPHTLKSLFLHLSSKALTWILH